MIKNGMNNNMMQIYDEINIEDKQNVNVTLKIEKRT